jgi:hypothetical protein
MRREKLAAIAGLAAAALVVGSLVVSLTAAEKHIICHFDGQAGTTKFQRIECGSGCVNGHFINNTTPKAGHELDILDPESGLCPDEEPPSPTPTPTPTPEPTP